MHSLVGEATVAMDVVEVNVTEDELVTMFSASLSLTPGFTLQTDIIAPFLLDSGDTGTLA